jgi:hypothetical protein
MNEYNKMNKDEINKINLTKDEVDMAVKCMNKVIKCYHLAPILNNEERYIHIKSCQEMVINCYLNILSN